MLALIRRTERDCNTGSPCPRRPADAVNVGFGHVGEVIIDNVADLGNVETSRCDISRDEDFGSAVTERAERFFALRL